MKIVSTSYTNTPGFNDPLSWLKRIDFYTGILEQLATRHEVHSIEQINYQGELQQQRVLYHFLDFKKSNPYFPLKLHRFIRALNPDIVLVNGLIFPLQLIQLRRKLGRRVKIIVLHRGENPARGLKRLFQKAADRCTDAYLFTSAGFGQAWAAAGIISNRNKIHEVIQASSVFKPMDKTTAREIVSIKGSPVFLWVGRLDANKDPLTVVKAFIQFARFEPGAVLYMIYQSEELLDDIKELTDSHAGAATPVILVGKLAHDTLQHWYNAADFIISGSHHEGSGIAVCEAMSCGCVPVLTDIISFSKMTGPGRCGLLYEPGNTAALLQVLMQTKNMDMEAERAKVLHQFKTEYSFEAVAGKIEKVIDSIKR